MPAVKSTTSPTISGPDSGGRGPVHKLPTGGSGDDDWRRQPPGRRGPRERLHRARVALAVLMTTSVGLFAAVSAAYLSRRGQFIFDPISHSYVLVWKAISIPRLLWWNCAFLVGSSLTLEIARHAHFQENAIMDEWLGIAWPTLRRALPWEVLSLLLASAFIGGQFLAWTQLQSQGVFLGSGPSSQFYYFLTGLHGLHLLGGMIVLGWAVLAALLRRSLESRQILVDVTAWYWHALTIVWFGIFALLKICQ